jgi:hypothetical protein
MGSAASWACTIIVDTSGLSRGIVPEGGASADGPSAEAAFDSGGKDDAGGTDGRTNLDGGATPFCSRHDAAFCEDFDDPGTGLSAAWQTQFKNATFAKRAEGSAPSGPNVGYAQTGTLVPPDPDAGAFAQALLIHGVGASPSLVRLDFSMRLDSYSVSYAGFTGIGLRIPQGGPAYYLRLVINGTTMLLTEYSETSNASAGGASLVPPALGTWARYTIVFDRVANKVALYDATNVTALTSRDILPNAPELQGGGILEVRTGIDYSGVSGVASGRIEVAFDDIAVAYQ